MNPRPHPYQITDSRFEVRSDKVRWWLHETWWQVARQDASEDAEAWHGPFETEAEAVAEMDRRMGR